jgi:hypothetical protein
MTKPQTYDHLKSRKKAVHKHVWIALDPELADEEADLKDKVNRLKVRQIARPDDPKVAQELASAQEELDQVTERLRDGNAVKFVFRSIGRRRYDDLLAENGPSEEQKAEAKKIDPNAELDFDPDKFPQELVAACIVEPELTKSEVADMFASEDWNAAELASLFETAFNANTTRRILDLGNGSRGMNGSGKN